MPALVITGSGEQTCDLSVGQCRFECGEIVELDHAAYEAKSAT